MNDIVEQSQPSAYERLKRRHQRFVDEYVNGKSAAAALRAVVGNKSKQGRIVAHRLLHTPEIQAAIKERTSLAIHDAGASTVAVMRHMAAVATSDIRKLTNPDGTHKAPHELDAETAMAVKSIEVEEVSTGGREGTRYKYQFWDKPKAAEFIGKASGLIQPAQLNDNRRTTNNTLVVQGGLSSITEWLGGFARVVPEKDVTPSVQDRPVLPSSIHAEQEGS